MRVAKSKELNYLQFWIIFLLVLCLVLPACGKQSASVWQEQYDLGVRYLSEGNYEKAIIAFTAAIEIDAKRPEAYVGRGDAYIGSGETEENLAAAMADYEEALAIDESQVDAWLGLADVYIRQGDYDKAIEILREALESTGDQAIENEIESHTLKSNAQLQAIFSDPLSVDEITSNGLPFLDCKPENNPSVSLWNNKIYITDNTLVVRDLSRGMGRTETLKKVGFSPYGIDCLGNLKDAYFHLENGVCTEFYEISFSDIDETIILEISSDEGTVNLLLGFENDMLEYIECDRDF